MPELNYEEIIRLYRLEKSSTKPIELQEDFYDKLGEFMRSERDSYLKALKDFSVAKARSFTNLKKIVEDFFDLREKKILNKALLALHSKEINEENLTLQEKKTMRALLEILQAHHALLDCMFIEPQEECTKLDEKDLNMISVTILSDVQSFIGADMKEYGPYEKGHSAELPHKIANLLISRKLAKANE